MTRKGIKMENDVRSRKWQITINNPVEKGFTHEVIKDTVKLFKGCVFWCMADEVGNEGGTYHTHIYMCCSGAVRFSTLKKRFEGAHFEVAKGTSAQNMDYVTKSGKWAGTDKSETQVDGTIEVFGECPVERQGQRNDINDLYDMIKQGMSNFDILETCPEYMLQLDKIERCRQVVLEDKYKREWRVLDTTYIYGETGSGKTRSIMETYGYDNVYRITDYQHPFDCYAGQDIVVFEEYRSNLRIGEMLNYLDGYPCELRCRYANKVACFTKVYLISNIPLLEQYSDVQKEQTETWKAFLRRIHKVRIFANGSVTDMSTDDYINGFSPVVGACPFNHLQ